ncbi:MAG: hypothetical protein ABIG95_05155 [Candidatus Woesearchaeota archaeon]
MAKANALNRKNLTKTIVLLAAGINSSNLLRDVGKISISTWENNYKPALIAKNDFDSKANPDSVEIIRWDKKPMSKNRKSYEFLWEIFLQKIEQNLIKDLDKNLEVFSKSVYNIIKIENQEYYQRKWKKFRKKKIPIPNSGQYFVVRLQQQQLIKAELERQERKVKAFLDKYSSTSFLYENKNERNFLICQLCQYFKELAIVKIDYDTSVEEVKKFIFTVALNEHIPFWLPSERYEYPFNIQDIKPTKFIERFKEYLSLHNLGIESLVILKPQYNKWVEEVTEKAEEYFRKIDEEKAIEQYEKQHGGDIKAKD